MKEIWKDVVGYEGWYSVSNMGRIKREHRGKNTNIGKILINQINNGYYRIIFFKNLTKKGFYVHRLVAEAFIGERPEGYEINHKDTNKMNNSADNLEYVTRTQNMIHAVKNNLCHPIKGEEHKDTHLFNKDIINIRNTYSKGFITMKSLGKKYGISTNSIRCIIRYKSWKHI